MIEWSSVFGKISLGLTMDSPISLKLNYLTRLSVPFLLFLLVCLIPAISYGQSSFSKRHADVFSLRDSVDHISDTIMKVITNEAFTKEVYDGGSQLKGIYSHGKLIKIEAWFGLSYGINTCTYYVKGDQLLLAIESFKVYHYDEASANFDYASFDIGHKGKYLFEADKLIDYESLGHWRFEDDTLDAEEVLTKEFNRYKSLLESK